MRSDVCQAVGIESNGPSVAGTSFPVTGPPAGVAQDGVESQTRPVCSLVSLNFPNCVRGTTPEPSAMIFDRGLNPLDFSLEVHLKQW